MSNINLYKHQQQALQFLQTAGSGILALEMGLGKTITAMLAEKQFREELAGLGRTLVVCPAFLVPNWRNEYRKFFSEEPFVGTDTRGGYEKGNVRVLVLSYERLVSWDKKGFIKPGDFHTLIVDESHYIKNYKSNRSKVLLKYKYTTHKILLSGTPLINRPIEMWTQLQMISPRHWWDVYQFIDDFCIQNHWGQIISQGKNIQKFADRVGSFMFRRRSDEVEGMPSVIKTYLPVDLKIDERKIVKDIKGMISENRNEALGALVRYRRQLAVAKAAHFVRKMKHLTDEQDHVLLFSQFKDSAKQLAEGLDGLLITGDVDVKDRIRLIEEFRDRGGKFICATLPSLAEGANLDWIDSVWFIDFAWTPAAHNQGIGRLRRITRKGSVPANFLYVENSIDQVVMKALQRKEELIKNFLDREEVYHGNIDISQEVLDYITNL